MKKLKEYVKPTFEYVEMRPEERLAACRYVSQNAKKRCTTNFSIS